MEPKPSAIHDRIGRLARRLIWKAGRPGIYVAAYSRPFRKALRAFSEEMHDTRRYLRALKIFRTLKHKKDLKLHLGCGQFIWRGWVNLDLNQEGECRLPDERDAETVFVEHDLLCGLPLADGSVNYIYSSHLWEHFDVQDGFRLLQECHRVLVPGGVFRVALPDFRASFRAYLANDKDYFDLADACGFVPEYPPGTRTIQDYINWVVHQSGTHKCVYDPEKLVAMLHAAGFGQAVQATYKEGLDSSLPVRRKYSFYVEATKS
jgi:predicted SAM-dependent methyltransferase